MSTRANVLVVEKNGDWERTSQVYRHTDGYVSETGKELAIYAYMAKRHSEKDTVADESGNEVVRDNFKRIRNRFLGYLQDTSVYEFEDFGGGLHGDIEYLYLVKIERVEDGSVEVKVSYIQTPIDSDRNEYLQKILNGEGTEIEVAVN